MPVRTPCPTVPSAAERGRLKKMAYGHKTERRLRVRAQVVLPAAHGHSNACIARETGLYLDTVRRWRGRFCPGGPARARRPSTLRPYLLIHTATGRRGHVAGLPAACRE
ncbi:helix-turn-helix domain-containing protein [Streptomyces sp. NPDC004629]|uniref:helix-turn-helix domain-containing protein n=1 Tax=Streptomyces sp. NPDC004629 TaxID=3364705 RepID=UPI0036BE0AEB